MAETKIPRATAKRLPIYYRYLNILLDADKKRVSSTELSEAVKVDSATIRRDFSYFGALGKRGYGYDVETLLAFFKKILNQDTLTNVALIGVGNLGHALLNFNFHKNSNVRISAAFDVNEAIANTVQSGVPVYPMTELKKQLIEQQIEIAILTVPTTVVQKITDELVDANVKGIMNFTPLRISVPETVRVQNVDLTNELQTLIYFIEHYGQQLGDNGQDEPDEDED
ncbi:MULTISPECIES: redox-sensing transcriptional repressor Rex [Lactiplantibacillus]|jgi:redox-sensing transcriptional repressor|uniref:Redox-sensing transcriptional repressor Rex n=4 Tax=Lactiplantibacillus pentosus TaxID=1589 RepID=A0A241RMW0_LACPE|nr:MULTISPECIES: redox-sensing transcriptional repressor Rex [Lactiplantibacillus]CCC16454.1 redox-sensing transcriptional repressor rex [Lactiplantibacillus pentosus IG1]BBM21029.1 redox-sensing transcriptional repressor Rex [Lactiplantibacillus plantarum]ASG79232.1 redox-sensing transcriptional repressor Rex [Lactiplantibacillus pentosus]AUI79613.1 redox-sensing transcriptional repressor Rex [Lactiplantibacillus pentosus]AYG36511.1 redox-sensing transcriptional repressor Rex [Lactiplantibaci